MKKIKLSQNKYTLVDNADYDWLKQWEWKVNGHGYVYRVLKINKKHEWIWMHRIINKTSSNLHTDHIDGNTLNNQRNNLRSCNRFENMQNRKLNRNNASGYKGVCWHKIGKKWVAQIFLKRKAIYLGYFKDKKEAALAYNEAAKKYFGKFSRLNKINKVGLPNLNGKHYKLKDNK